jgi:hypothetical protein
MLFYSSSTIRMMKSEIINKRLSSLKMHKQMIKENLVCHPYKSTQCLLREIKDINKEIEHLNYLLYKLSIDKPVKIFGTRL